MLATKDDDFLDDYIPADDRSLGFDDPPDIAESGTALISADLLACINELLRGGKIERIDDDSQLRNSVKLKEQVKLHRLTLTDEKERITGPLYKQYKTALDVFTEKEKALISLEKNLTTEAARYQLAKQAEADRLQQIENERVEVEKRRLAELEHQNLMKEEATRRAAEDAANKAANENDAEKRAAFIEAANKATAEADAALAAATVAAAGAAIAAEAVPIKINGPAQIRGLKAKMIYTANVMDYVECALAILSSDDRAAMLNETFKKVVQSAANKKAAYQGAKFKLAGCVLVSTPGAR